ncbi:MAG: hypothetical protein EOM18_17530 [Clostridia bacterium]|nr:hypothetical protein [Clostridia bacterium]
MKKIMVITLMLLWHGWADDASRFFSRAAFLYVEGKLGESLIQVKEGLKLFPDDEKLARLARQIEAIQEENRNNQHQDNDSNQNDPNNEENDSNKEQENRNQPQISDDAQENDDKSEDPSEQSPDGENTPEDAPVKEEPIADADALTQEQAEQLLKSFENQDMPPPIDNKIKSGQGRTVGKDW